MRIDPRSSLSVQLIHEANFGSERFAPFGPALNGHDEGPLPFTGPGRETFRGSVREPDAVLLCPPVAGKPAPCPADTHPCDARLAPLAAYLRTQPCPDPTTRVVVREVAVPTILPTSVVGSLLDVLA